MSDPLLVRRFERLGNLLGNRKCFVDRNRATGNPLREILALDQFHHKGGGTPALFEAVDRRDVRMIQRREDFGFALKTCEPIMVSRKRGRKNLDGDLTLQLCTVARYTCPIPPSPICAVIS